MDDTTGTSLFEGGTVGAASGNFSQQIVTSWQSSGTDAGESYHYQLGTLV